MKRRNFINSAALAGFGLLSNSFILAEKRKKEENLRGTYSQNKNVFSIYTKLHIAPIKVFHITDTHLSLDDSRGLKYKEFSKRMAGAYRISHHF